MVGHKLGEFSPTRKFVAHTSADKKAAQAAQSSVKTPPGTAAPAASKPAAPAEKDNK
jgi:hypothetical protein